MSGPAMPSGEWNSARATSFHLKYRPSCQWHHIKQITEIGAQKNLDLNIIAAKDHAEAFLMVDTDRAAAFVMDDILLFSLVATSASDAVDTP
jgi:ABC-type amino acid transport substrate-binding protein